MKTMIFDNCDWNYPVCGGYRVYEGRKYWHIDSLSNYQGAREFRYSLSKDEYTKEQVTNPEWIQRNEEYFVDCYDNRRIPEGIKIKYLGKVY